MQSQSHYQPHLFHPTSVYIRVSNWLERHPRSVSHAMHVTVFAALGFTLLNAGLFTVQYGRTSALTTVNGKAYGLMSIDDAKQLLTTQHSSTVLTVNIGGETVMLNAKTAGVAVDAAKTFEPLTAKKGWHRIPLVSAIGNLFEGIKPVYNTDKKALAATLAPYITEQVVPAQNAKVAIPIDTNQPATITPEVSGKELNAEVAADVLASSVSANEFTTKIEARVLLPKWTELEMRAFLPSVEAARRTSLTIQAESKKIELPSDVLASMLRVNTEGAQLKMTLDTAQLKAFLEAQGQVFYIAPIATKTILKDGSEISRIDGVAGKQLDATNTAILATAAFENGVQSVVPAIATVTPEVLVTRTYSNTDTGLYKTIEDFAKSHNGLYRVAAVELNGPGNRSAFYNADTSIITASTYKLFISYGILQRVQAGSLSLESSTSLGTVDYCMYKMIHNSDNDCASALQKLLGSAAFDNKLKADGFTSTTLNNVVGDKHSTARDEMKLVTQLYNRELLNEEWTNYLFELMKNQVYRSGIPAGSRGSIVADKVGFLYALNHDIGVVYGPKSTYALVILTDGAGGWNNVKLLAQQIYDFYNQ